MKLILRILFFKKGASTIPFFFCLASILQIQNKLNFKYNFICTRYIKFKFMYKFQKDLLSRKMFYKKKLLMPTLQMQNKLNFKYNFICARYINFKFMYKFQKDLLLTKMFYKKKIINANYLSKE